ncbi:MAG: hypothetical protein P1U61_03345 [Legionellaceae bacterium]|nr:hypothetical protein [Legionellaceae bacterium]
MPISHFQAIKADKKNLKVGDRERVDAFVDFVNARIPMFNDLIDLYHAASTPEEKLTRLKALYDEVMHMDSIFSNREVANSIDYILNFHAQLFLEIQAEFKALGISSMQPEVLRESLTVANDPTALAEVIANMSPIKVNELAEILESGEGLVQSRIKNLYQVGEAGKEAFDAFYNTHKIRFLGGGNSKNFGIQNKQTRDVVVLKLENRMGRPSQIESHLRAHGLQDVFTPILAERQASYVPSTVRITRRLQVTEFCRGFDLIKNAKQYPDNEARLDAAFDVYGQMGEVLRRISAAGCAFPDMKNSNWLMDDSRNLRIADTKAFLWLNEDGSVDKSEGLIVSMHLIDPAMRAASFSGDKMHTYMYGKNLYQYVMQYSDDDFYVDPDDINSPPKKDADLSFDYPIFKDTERGRQLEILIKSMIQASPEARPSLEDACKKLQQINTPLQQQAVDVSVDLSNEKDSCRRALNRIQALGVGEYDVKMNQLIAKIEALIQSASSQNEIELVKEKMIVAYERIVAGKSVIDEIKVLVQNQSGAEAAMRQKVILEAVGEVPLSERKNIPKAKTEKTQKAMQLLREGRQHIKETSQTFKAELAAQRQSSSGNHDDKLDKDLDVGKPLK